MPPDPPKCFCTSHKSLYKRSMLMPCPHQWCPGYAIGQDSSSYDHSPPCRVLASVMPWLCNWAGFQFVWPFTTYTNEHWYSYKAMAVFRVPEFHLQSHSSTCVQLWYQPRQSTPCNSLQSGLSEYRHKRLGAKLDKHAELENYTAIVLHNYRLQF